MDFGELKNDTNFVSKSNSISDSLDKIEKHMKKAIHFHDYDNLSIEEKVKFDLYLSYAINSLFWMHLKLQGTDPNTHGIKNELSRVRECMIKDKKLHDHKTIRPVLDKGAAGRFIKHGLNDRKKKKDERQNNMPLNKKIRFDNSDDELNDRKKKKDGRENNNMPMNKKIRFDNSDDE